MTTSVASFSHVFHRIVHLHDLIRQWCEVRVVKCRVSVVSLSHYSRASQVMTSESGQKSTSHFPLFRYQQQQHCPMWVVFLRLHEITKVYLSTDPFPNYLQLRLKISFSPVGVWRIVLENASVYAGLLNKEPFLKPTDLYLNSSAWKVLITVWLRSHCIWRCVLQSHTVYSNIWEYWGHRTLECCEIAS